MPKPHPSSQAVNKLMGASRAGHQVWHLQEPSLRRPGWKNNSTEREAYRSLLTAPAPAGCGGPGLASPRLFQEWRRPWDCNLSLSAKNTASQFTSSGAIRRHFSSLGLSGLTCKTGEMEINKTCVKCLHVPGTLSTVSTTHLPLCRRDQPHF